MDSVRIVKDLRIPLFRLCFLDNDDWWEDSSEEGKMEGEEDCWMIESRKGNELSTGFGG